MQNQLWSRLKEKVDSLKPFTVAFAFSPWLIILYLVVSSYVGALDSDDQQVIQSFIEWFGTAYSLFLALVLVNVWAKFDAVEREFDSELDAIATLYQTSNYIEESSAPSESDLQDLKNSINASVKEYIQHVIDNYQKEYQTAQQRRNGEQILERIGHYINLLAHNNLNDSLISELFENLNEARDMRSDRISHSKQRTPETVWLVAVIASIVWLIPFFGLVIIDPLVKLFMIGGVTFVITIVLVIIKDLDEPFEGTWQVSLEEWQGFLELIDPKPHLLVVFNTNNRLADLMSRSWLGKPLSLKQCKLSSLTREDFFRRRWKTFLKNIQRDHPKINRKVDIFYLEQFSASGFSKHTTGNNTPFMIIKKGDKFEVLLSNQEIEGCASFSRFEEIFNSKIGQFIS